MLAAQVHKANNPDGRASAARSRAPKEQACPPISQVCVPLGLGRSEKRLPRGPPTVKVPGIRIESGCRGETLRLMTEGEFTDADPAPARTRPGELMTDPRYTIRAIATRRSEPHSPTSAAGRCPSAIHPISPSTTPSAPPRACSTSRTWREFFVVGRRCGRRTSTTPLAGRLSTLARGAGEVFASPGRERRDRR